MPLLRHFWDLVDGHAHIAPGHRAGRLKQWLNYLRRRYPQAEAVYADVRTINDPVLVRRRLLASFDAGRPTDRIGLDGTSQHAA